MLKKEGQDFCVLKARYPNNPALSDKVAQCGVATTPVTAACRRHATKTRHKPKYSNHELYTIFLPHRLPHLP